MLLRKGKLKRVLGIEDAILNGMVKAKLTKEVTFQQKPEEGEKASHLEIWGRSVQAKGKRSCKIPKESTLIF